LKSGSLNLLEPSGPVQACMGIVLPFLHKYKKNGLSGRHFLKAVAGYRMKDLKRNEDVREELGITDIRLLKENGQNIRHRPRG
jgi:hypothetical protein